MHAIQKSFNRQSASLMTYGSLCGLTLGSLLHVVAYGSFQVIVIGVFFLMIIMPLLYLKGIGGREERLTYLLVYSIGWFWAGIAALMSNFLNDPSQLINDAVFFYETSSSGLFSDLSLKDAIRLSEGSLVIKIWTFFYDMFASIGFERGRYIGVTTNVTFVALTAVVGIKMMKTIFGRDKVRMRRFAIVFSLCGIFWLFGALHIRDAPVMFAVTLLAYYWVRYLAYFSFSNVVRLVIAIFGAVSIFVFLRVEFLVVPPAMIIAGLVAVVIGKKRGIGYGIKILVVVVGLIVSAYIFSPNLSDVYSTLLLGKEDYVELSFAESGTDSLGYSFIVNQPFFLRLIIGFVYLMVFPIPFWTGFQLESAYHLFKSFHVIFMYGIMPLFGLAVWRLINSKMLRTPQLLFLMFSFAGFALSIAVSSLETRHVGVFLPLLLVFSMVPDLSFKIERFTYRILLTLFLSTIFLVHLVWAIIKFT